MESGNAEPPRPFVDRRKGRPRHVPFTLADMRAKAADRRWLSVRELADLSGFSQDKILSLVKSRYLKGRQIAGQWIIHFDSARRFLNELGMIEK